MKSLAFGISGDYAQLTGGYAYDRRVIEELRLLGWRADFVDVGSGYPRPDSQTLATTRRALAAQAAGTPLLVDGLVYGLIPKIAAELAPSYPLIALVHHPLAFETGWSRADAERLHRSEQAALAVARAVIATSATTGRILVEDYRVPTSRVTVAIPGIDRFPPARGSGSSTVELLSVGAIVPRKGHDILVAALASLIDLSWHLTIAGDPERNPEMLVRLRADIERFGLSGRVTLAGGVSHNTLAELYDRSDLFVLASHYEGYGMAYTEALARGLPVIGTTGGAIPEAVPDGAGVLVPPGDVTALRDALRRLITSRDQRKRLSDAANDAVQRMSSWRETAVLVARAIEAVT